MFTYFFSIRSMAGVFGRITLRSALPLKQTQLQIFSIVPDVGVRFASVNTVKAAVLHEVKSPLKIEKIRAVKKLQKDEVRLKVHYCGLNVSDLLITTGNYDVAPKLPFVPGYEVAGKIMEVGSEAASEGFVVGNRVLGLNKNTFTGFAEETVVKLSDLWNIPSSLSYKQTAALADSYATSLIGLARRAHIKEGDTLLITAGPGGLGLAAVDIAANVYKAKVIAVCATEDKAALLRDKGAWAALAFHPKDIIKRVNDVTDGKGVQIVFDAVGGPVFETALKCVAHEGMVVVGGFAVRKVPQIQAAELVSHSFSLIGVSLRNYKATNLLIYRQVVQDALDMCEQELVSPHIAKVFKLDNINEAFKYIEDNTSTGKIVIEVDT